MRVANLIGEVCLILGLEEEKQLIDNYLQTNIEEEPGEQPNNEELEQQENSLTEEDLMQNVEIKKLFHLLQFSLRELCTNHINLVAEQTFSGGAEVELANFANFIRLVGVYQNSQPVQYKCTNRIITLPSGNTYTIKYLTYPTVSSLDEDCFNFGIDNIGLIQLGLCAYYCLANARFEEFESFNKAYIEKAEKAKTLKFIQMPQRSWNA